ncbi:hypothetical protein [Pseudoponticoccus marisrubri]|uniref:Uncharacterized protein n=1 Tax=Pseudoponticoccus marisrubri TaxID=1685382 RepID=A0A0W7WIL8_9RHOB|nr:hypothetical protein [Pseudoponticoccus marisrubri]KUF10359.1 hypothetical protein AVJ23_13240 [Pseudoponticoccus marisrubri]
MSDPVTNVEIEDVLSSIRRLVSEESRPKQGASAARPRQLDRLVLEPSLRVPSEAPPPEPRESVQKPVLLTNPEPADSQDDPAPGSPLEQLVEQEVARALIDAVEEEAEDDAEEADETPEAVSDGEEETAALLGQIAAYTDAVEAEAAQAAEDDATPEAAHAAPVSDWGETRVAEPEHDSAEAHEEAQEAPVDEVQADPEDASDLTDPVEDAPELTDPAEEAPEPEATAEPEPEPETATEEPQPLHAQAPQAETLESKIAALETLVGRQKAQWEDEPQPAKPSFVHRPAPALEWEDHTPDPMERLGVTHEAAPTYRDETPPAPSAEEGGLEIDETVLREMVVDIVRQELQGALGERITRNVRKLVRREIHRVLMSQEFD